MRILFATDGSEAAAGAGRLLGLFSLPEGSAVQALCVRADAPPDLPAWARDSQEGACRHIVESAAAALRSPGVEATAAVRRGPLAAEILDAADVFGADLLVVGAAGQSRLEAFFLGSVARNVAKHARGPVLVAREPVHALGHVVLALDGSEHARRAAEFTATLPLPPGAEATAVTVVRPYAPFPGLAPDDPAGFQREVEEVRRVRWRDGTRIAEEGARALAAAGLPADAEVREGDPAREIRKLATARRADLIVAGARGVSLIQGLLLGSVADRLLETAPSSVVLVR
jgi:nucleotide-binding universal stress UspA family protein